MQACCLLNDDMKHVTKFRILVKVSYALFMGVPHSEDTNYCVHYIEWWGVFFRHYSHLFVQILMEIVRQATDMRMVIIRNILDFPLLQKKIVEANFLTKTAHHIGRQKWNDYTVRIWADVRLILGFPVILPWSRLQREFESERSFFPLHKITHTDWKAPMNDCSKLQNIGPSKCL